MCIILSSSLIAQNVSTLHRVVGVIISLRVIVCFLRESGALPQPSCPASAAPAQWRSPIQLQRHLPVSSHPTLQRHFLFCCIFCMFTVAQSECLHQIKVVTFGSAMKVFV